MRANGSCSLEAFHSIFLRLALLSIENLNADHIKKRRIGRRDSFCFVLGREWIASSESPDGSLDHVRNYVLQAQPMCLTAKIFEQRMRHEQTCRALDVTWDGLSHVNFGK